MKNQIKVAVIKSNFGNISSINNALNFLNYEFDFLEKPLKINKYSHLILPGVGSFKEASKKLKKSGWFEAIRDHSNEKPFLGICLGMQLMFTTSEEEGISKGINLFEGKCEKFKTKILPLPHMGFNIVKHGSSKLWKNIPNNSPFYFVHSFRINKTSEKYNLSLSKYGEEFVSVVEKNKIIGAQFHPEKSHSFGLKFLKNFIEEYK